MNVFYEEEGTFRVGALLADQGTSLQVDRPTRMERYYLMVTTGDEVLDYRKAVARYPGAKQLVIRGSDHGFAEFEQYLDSVVAFADGRSL